ncbi:MAG: ABC transporter ATP-binding protein, partial [Clostridia bacterium]|nr:ABC transporter ATP-binding protein [Clostridia bacterium]
MKLKAKTYTIWNLLPMLVGIAPWAMGASLFANVLIGVIPLLSALATAWFIDSALALAAGAKTMADMILPLLAAFAIQAADFSRWEIDYYAGQSVKRSLLLYYRPAIAAKAASLQYQLVEDGRTWDLISRMTEKPHDKMFDILDGVIYLVQLLVGLAGVLVLVASHVWWAAALIAVLTVPAMAVSLKLGGRTYAEKAKIERDKRRFIELRRMDLSRACAEERALFGYGDAVADQFEGEIEPAYANYFKFQRRNQAVSGGMNALFGLLMIGAAAVLAVPAMNGAITIGTMIAVVREILRMTERMGGLNYCMRCVGEGREYARDLTAFAGLPEQDGALDAPAEPPLPFESLEFRHVSFAYPGTGRKILDDFSLTLEKGKHYAFVGVNGAGKTTMTKLITGLYDNFEGDILLNGKDIRAYSPAQLKSLAAPVFQDFARYQVEIRDAIALGIPAREARVEEAVRAAGLEEAARNLKKGLDTPLGKTYEGGQDLSGGQWQRLAIAR